MFFVCIGVYAASNHMFQVGETLFIGVVGYILLQLDFHPVPILLGFVSGPRFENFRRALLISRGDLTTFIDRPISAFFPVHLRHADHVAQIYVWLRKPRSFRRKRRSSSRFQRRPIPNWPVDGRSGSFTGRRRTAP
jgi:putative tricarboxylic transport membrane protein